MAEFPIPEIAAIPEKQSSRKGQFGVALEPEIIRICAFAVLVGLIAGFVAQGLLLLIQFFTNIFFYGKFSFAYNIPAHNHLGLWVMLIPPIGALLVGIMIHFWEPTLKGHGIPEAMESVLFGHSRMRLRVALLKPLATAFAIGTGGPFGAEGPIIQTGAALGSLFGQAVGLTPYYRRVLLASGAAAGMAATFSAPLGGIPHRNRTPPLRTARSFLHSCCARSLSCHLRSNSLHRMGAALPYSDVSANGNE